MNTTENKAVGTVRFNKEQGGIEIVFSKGAKLSEAQITLLKDKGFRWHKLNSYWYARFTDERFEWTKKVFASWKPTQKDVKAVKATAEKRMAEQSARKAERSTKKVSQADRLDRLEQMLAALLADKGVGV